MCLNRVNSWNIDAIVVAFPDLVLNHALPSINTSIID